MSDEKIIGRNILDVIKQIKEKALLLKHKDDVTNFIYKLVVIEKRAFSYAPEDSQELSITPSLKG